MITNRGRDIVARFLAGQTPSAFSHIAVGIGPQPRTDTVEPDSFAVKTSLDFEALRIPITTASVVKESGKTKVVFSGPLPADGRYEITEIGLYPAKENSLLNTAKDSLIFSFIDKENWTIGGGSDIIFTSLVPGLDITPSALSGVSEDINAVFVPATNPVLLTPNRLLQRSRLGNEALLIRGDYSTLTGNPYSSVDAGFTVGGSYVYVDSFSANFATARRDDEIKISFSLMPTIYTSIASNLTDGISDKVGVRLRLEFDHGAESAAAEWVINSETTSGVLPEEVNYASNPYYVATKAIKDFKYSADFQWSLVSSVKLYVAVDGNASTTGSDYWVSVDALRFDSKNDNNPIYGLVTYSIVSNEDGSPQVKNAGLESQIEFKVSLESD